MGSPVWTCDWYKSQRPNTPLTPKIGDLKTPPLNYSQTEEFGATLWTDRRCEVIVVASAPKIFSEFTLSPTVFETTGSKSVSDSPGYDDKFLSRSCCSVERQRVTPFLPLVSWNGHQTEGLQIGDHRLSTSCWVVQRPDHHCGDDLVSLTVLHSPDHSNNCHNDYFKCSAVPLKSPRIELCSVVKCWKWAISLITVKHESCVQW